MEKTNRIQNKSIAIKTEQIKKIIKVLNKCKISFANHSSTQLPFFFRDINQVDFIENTNNIERYNIPESLNRNIKLIFQLLGDPEKEIYIGGWTIMSLKECTERYNELSKKDRKDVFDIGYRYMGMGHIEMISCDLNNHLLFYRPDGGSNGWDRQDNYNNLINNGANNYEKFFFGKWFFNIDIE